jgi:citrate lyase beta subunit
LDCIKKIEATLADCIILDLEDSVPLDQKDSSRISLYNYLEETKPSISVFVRINPLDTDEGVEDLALFSKNADLYDALVLPKIENQKTLDGIPNIPLVLLIETPLAVKNLVVLAKNKQVVGVALGGADLSASLGSDMSWDSLLFHRSAVVLECAINNLFSLDSPFMDIGAPEALAAECALSSKMGFNGKAAIHPSQIDIIQGSFLPTEEEINEAKEILAAFYASPDAAVAVQGKMVDLPVVKSMEKRLLLAGFDPEELKNKGA